MSEKLNLNSENFANNSAGQEPVPRRALGAKVMNLISEKYDIKERKRVERIKADFEDDYSLTYNFRYNPTTSRPGVFKKGLRLLGDALGLKSAKDERLREREAAYVAINECDAEMRAQQEAYEEERRLEDIRSEEEDEKQEAEQAVGEREYLERGMAEVRDVSDYNKTSRFKNQRAQELVERDLNSRLLTVDKMEDEVIVENPEISKRSVQFEGVEIPVYDLKGIPFATLSTTIDYRSANRPGEIGTETFQTVINDPSVWAERRDEAEKASGFGTRNGDARGDTISTSYWNSEKNINSHVKGELIYGFSKVDADSIINISNGDGGTSNMAGRAETNVSGLGYLENLEGADGVYSYNELLLRRYSENGIPKKPDYIIVEDGKISEAAQRHANYYHIPIVNIENSFYREKMLQRGERVIDSITEKDSFVELDKKLSELESMSIYKHTFWNLSGIGRKCDIAELPWSATEQDRRNLKISKMEQLKRLDFIKETLVNETRKIKIDTENGVRASDTPSQFQYFNISIDDLNNNTRSNILGDNNGALHLAPGNCSSIDIDFKLKNSSRSYKTNIYDGENIYMVNEALSKRSIRIEDIERADSGFYIDLEPVVREYFAAYRENQKIAKNK